MDFLSAPIITLSFANSNSIIDTFFFPDLAANNAASLIKLAKSAPENPGVPLAMNETSTSLSTGTFLM